MRRSTLVWILAIVSWTGVIVLVITAAHGGVDATTAAATWTFIGALICAATLTLAGLICRRATVSIPVSVSYDLGFEQGYRTARQEDPPSE